MKIVDSKDVMSLNSLRDKLQKNEGVLVWLISKEDVVFMKNKLGNYRMGWVSLKFDRGEDNDNLCVNSIEELVTVIKETISKGGNFYWFETERGFYEWMYAEKLYQNMD